MSRFEVVRSDAGFFGRFIANNGKEIWRTSEVYERRRTAVRAVRLIEAEFYAHRIHGEGYEHYGVQLRSVDERATP